MPRFNRPLERLDLSGGGVPEIDRRSRIGCVPPAERQQETANSPVRGGSWRVNRLGERDITGCRIGGAEGDELLDD